MINSDLVSDIRQAKNPIHMSTNTGSKRLDLEGKVPENGTTQYNFAGIANILGLGKLIKAGYRITMDMQIENCFNIY